MATNNHMRGPNILSLAAWGILVFGGLAVALRGFSLGSATESPFIAIAVWMVGVALVAFAYGFCITIRDAAIALFDIRDALAERDEERA